MHKLYDGRIKIDAAQLRDILNNKNDYTLYESIAKSIGDDYISYSGTKFSELVGYSVNGTDDKYLKDEDGLGFLFNKDGVFQVDDMIVFLDKENSSLKMIPKSLYPSFKSGLRSVGDSDKIYTLHFQADQTLRCDDCGAWISCGYCALVGIAVGSGVLAAAGLLELGACVHCAMHFWWN